MADKVLGCILYSLLAIDLGTTAWWNTERRELEYTRSFDIACHHIAIILARGMAWFGDMKRE